MYYAEEIVNGVLCRRGTPDGEWIPFTLEELTKKYVIAQNQIAKLASELEDATAFAVQAWKRGAETVNL